MDQSTQTWTCTHCGKECSRTTAKGRVPKWCDKDCRNAWRARPKILQTWTCLECGVECQRTEGRGTPKYCNSRCQWRATHRVTGTCKHCGMNYTGTGSTYCSRACKVAATPPRPKKPAPPKIDQRSPLRKAYEDGDHDGLAAALKGMTLLSDDGCWIWQRTLDPSGYPRVNVAGRTFAAHRLMLQADYRLSLGSQHVHHKCATPSCINPDHLQPVTHRENAAEMMARHSYLARIRELESALAVIDPGHPLLAVIPVA